MPGARDELMPSGLRLSIIRVVHYGLAFYPSETPPHAVVGHQHEVAPGERDVGVSAAPLLPRSSLST